MVGTDFEMPSGPGYGEFYEMRNRIKVLEDAVKQLVTYIHAQQAMDRQKYEQKDYPNAR